MKTKIEECLTIFIELEEIDLEVLKAGNRFHEIIQDTSSEGRPMFIHIKKVKRGEEE